MAKEYNLRKRKPEAFNREEYQTLLSELFPSAYMTNKVNKLKRLAKPDPESSSSSSSSSEDEDYEEDELSEDCESDEEQEENPQKVNIVVTIKKNKNRRRLIEDSTDESNSDYDEEDDCILFEGEATFVRFEERMFAVFFPHDLHLPGTGEEQTPVRKVVVKVKI